MKLNSTSPEKGEIHFWHKKLTKVAQELLKGPKLLKVAHKLYKTSKVAKKLPSTIYICLDTFCRFSAKYSLIRA